MDEQLKRDEQNKKLSKIYNHFGRDAQIKKLREEVEEFIEALQSGNMEHATEEFADVAVVLGGFCVSEPIDDDLFSSTFDYKVDRTDMRIDSGYYENEVQK